MQKTLPLHKAETFMDIQTKYKLIERIIRLEDEAVLNQVKAILEAEEQDWWSDLNPELKASIEQGLRQSDEGRGRPHEEVMAAFRKKYKR